MSVWEKYTNEQKNLYITFLKVYGALTNLFRQKKGELIPYLDSKFQETVYARAFNCENVDIGNTPHDVLSIFGETRIGIGLKTWMSSRPSFQKVMQLKRYQNEIRRSQEEGLESLAFKISSIKNEKMRIDYNRLGLKEENNIYHYITRDKGKFLINECDYPLIDTNNLSNLELTKTALSWFDGKKEYKFTFGDSQIWQKFDSSNKDNFVVSEFGVDIINDPFDFLLKSYLNLIDETDDKIEEDIIEAYLPLYSYRTKEVEDKSGLNAWRAAPKNKNTNAPRPLNEIYIPIPKEFHHKFPDFFSKNIIKIIEDRIKYKNEKEKRPEVRFQLILPNGDTIPALITGDNLKNFQSGSLTERDKNGRLFGQNALGQWLLIDVLGLNERTKVTREWLFKKGTDSLKIWRKTNDYLTFYIDFAPIGSFEAFMNDEPIPTDDEYID